MKAITSYLLTALLVLASCQDKEQETKESATENPDKPKIEKLVKDMYNWADSPRNVGTYNYIVKDSIVVGFDRIGYSLYLKRLYDTDFFSEEFINNMTAIINEQTRQLKTGETEWTEGDMSPFGGDDNPWCNCQDNDSYTDIKVTFDTLTADSAAIRWSWDKGAFKGTPDYNIRLKKEGGKWKITWMEGWDYIKNTVVE